METGSVSNSLVQSVLAEGAPSQDVRKTVNSIIGDLTEIATMAHGSGLLEGSRGGKGHVGVLNGKVIKFNTKLSERRNLQKAGADYEAMMQTCDDLRERLMGDLRDAMEISLRMDSSGAKEMNRISLEVMEKLGLERGADDHQDRLKQNRGLLERTAVAESVTMIRDLLKQAVRAKEPKLTERESALLKNQLGKETANYDFHIWRKVKAMGGLSTQAAGSAHVRHLAAVEKQVARIKFSPVGTGGARREFAQAVCAAGNEEMRNLLGRIRVDTRVMDDGSEKLQIMGIVGDGEVDPVDPVVGHGMLRLARVQALAKSMDVMFAKMKALYAEKLRAEGLPAAIRSSEVDGLGTSPVVDMLKRSLAKLLNRPEGQVDVNGLLQEKVWLSPNEYENLKSLMRNELLAFVAKQGIELVKERPDAEPKLSALVLLTKDLFRSCAQILDNDDEQAGSFSTDRVGLRVYTDQALTVFKNENYGVGPDMRERVIAENRRRLAGQTQNVGQPQNVEIERNLENRDVTNLDLENIPDLSDRAIENSN